MRDGRAIALALLALLGAVAVAAPASTAGSAPGDPARSSGSVAAVKPTPTATATTETDAASMGHQVSAFMQSSSGQTSEEVRSGMWSAAYANASNRTRVVERRVVDIRSRLDAVEDRKERLVAARRNGSIGEVEYRARMSALVGRMAALNRSIDETERQARAADGDVSTVRALRGRAANLSGPEVAAIAQSFAGGPPPGVPAGPNATRTPGGERGPPNGTGGPPDDSGGPPANGSRGPPNGTGGPPNGSAGDSQGSGNDRGQGDGNGQGQGNGNDRGQGDGDGQGRDDGNGR